MCPPELGTRWGRSRWPGSHQNIHGGKKASNVAVGGLHNAEQLSVQKYAGSSARPANLCALVRAQRWREEAKVDLTVVQSLEPHAMGCHVDGTISGKKEFAPVTCRKCDGSSVKVSRPAATCPRQSCKLGKDALRASQVHGTPPGSASLVSHLRKLNNWSRTDGWAASRNLCEGK